MRITEDWSRVRCIDPEADLEVLAGLGLQLQRELQETRRLGVAAAEGAGFVFESGAGFGGEGVFSGRPAEEMATLGEDLLAEASERGARAGLTGQQVILKGMESEFKTAGVLGLAAAGTWRVADYTEKKGDPQSFDFAYPLGGEVKFLQAVSLKSGRAAGLGLAAGFRGLPEISTMRRRRRRD